MGNGAAQVFAEDTSGDNWLRTGMGMPKTIAGIDTATGTDLFGRDQYVENVLAENMLATGGGFPSTTAAGINALNYNVSRTLSDPAIGYRCSASALI